MITTSQLNDFDDEKEAFQLQLNELISLIHYLPIVG